MESITTRRVVLIGALLLVALLMTALPLASLVERTPAGESPEAMAVVEYAGISAALADKTCRNTHHHHFRTINSVVREIHWIARVSQAGPNQLRYDWYSGRYAHTNGGSFQGYVICGSG